MHVQALQTLKKSKILPDSVVKCASTETQCAASTEVHHWKENVSTPGELCA